MEHHTEQGRTYSSNYLKKVSCWINCSISSLVPKLSLTNEHSFKIHSLVPKLNGFEVVHACHHKQKIMIQEIIYQVQLKEIPTKFEFPKHVSNFQPSDWRPSDMSTKNTHSKNFISTTKSK